MIRRFNENNSYNELKEVIEIIIDEVSDYKELNEIEFKYEISKNGLVIITGNDDSFTYEDDDVKFPVYKRIMKFIDTLKMSHLSNSQNWESSAFDVDNKVHIILFDTKYFRKMFDGYKTFDRTYIDHRTNMETVCHVYVNKDDKLIFEYVPGVNTSLRILNRLFEHIRLSYSDLSEVYPIITLRMFLTYIYKNIIKNENILKTNYYQFSLLFINRSDSLQKYLGKVRPQEDWHISDIQ